MARTTVAAVKNVLSTTLTDGQITAFIDDANVWVTDELGSAGFSTGRLEIIERYLACALCRLRDLGISSASMEGVSESYQVDSAVTDYLLRAASFDTSGKIRGHFLEGSSVGAVTFRLGTRYVDETDDK